MANGNPTSLRMAFGYKQARSSGLTDFSKGPESHEMNFYQEFKRLRPIIRQNPSLEPLIREMIAAQAAENLYSVDLIFMELRRRNLLPQSK
jgi:hypothetical protein